MIVVIDTNIWRKELFPGSNNSAALKYFVSNFPAILAIPEMLSWEIEIQLREFIADKVKAIAENQRQLRGVFGSLREAALPDSSEIETFIKSYASTLGVPTIRPEFSPERAKEACLRIFQKDSPFSGGQQFKDALLWEDCKSLTLLDNVVFATEDRVFFEQRQLGQINSVLRRETEALANKISIYSSLTDLLSILKTEKPAVPVEKQAELVGKLLGEGVVIDFLRNQAVSARHATSQQIKAFATENPTCLAVNFRFSWECTEAQSLGRSNIVLLISGSCTFSTNKEEFENIVLNEMKLSYEDENGELKSSTMGFMSANIVIGHASTKHEPRFLLDEVWRS